MAKPNYKDLFLEARKLLRDAVDRHGAHCGCQDIEEAEEGLCPGLQEEKDFLKKTDDI